MCVCVCAREDQGYHRTYCIWTHVLVCARARASLCYCVCVRLCAAIWTYCHEGHALAWHTQAHVEVDRRVTYTHIIILTGIETQPSQFKVTDPKLPDSNAGKKIAYNQRDAPWHTWTNRLGFSVMGIWADGSDITDVNAVCRSKRGAPAYIPPKDLVCWRAVCVCVCVLRSTSGM